MTDRQMRHMISHAIAAARPLAEKHYHVCWWEETVRCRHVRHTTERREAEGLDLHADRPFDAGPESRGPDRRAAADS